MANVQVLKVGHALVQGARGAKGGAASKDSVWGLALVQGNVVKFYGRRGGTMRYKTERKVNLDAALAQFQRKVDGSDGKDYQYADVTSNYADLVPNLAEVVGKGFYKAMSHGKLNTNSTRK